MHLEEQRMYTTLLYPRTKLNQLQGWHFLRGGKTWEGQPSQGPSFL